MTTDWSSTITPGQRRQFGFLQVDIVKHSLLKGTAVKRKEVRDNFYQAVRAALDTSSFYELKWEGDGGVFLLLVDSGKEFDRLVDGAFSIVGTMKSFNRQPTRNPLHHAIRIRVSCHAGEVTWDNEKSKIFGDELNWFMKHERTIGKSDRVVITSTVADQLDQMKPFFRKGRKIRGHTSSIQLWKDTQSESVLTGRVAAGVAVLLVLGGVLGLLAGAWMERCTPELLFADFIAKKHPNAKDVATLLLELRGKKVARELATSLDGAVLVATEDELFRYEDGQFISIFAGPVTALRPGDGFAVFLARDKTWRKWTERGNRVDEISLGDLQTLFGAPNSRKP